MLRVISGVHKGRKIVLPSGIRPTQAKVRKALFDVLGDIQGLSFLELFAGSGAVGFEALSHGVSELALVEHNRSCLLAIKKSQTELKLKECTIYPLDVSRAIENFRKKSKKFDIVFLDPPYYQDLGKKTLQILGAYDIVSPHGLVIAEHFKSDDLPEAIEGLVLLKRKKYGDTILSFYRKE